MAAPRKGSFPRPDPEAREAFEALVPDGPGVSIRPMFGNVAAFVNGNMFGGLFGNDLFVRLPDEDRAELRDLGGAAFEPMPGRAMKEYVTVPSWRSKHRDAERWLARSLDWASELPPKPPKKR